MYICVCVCASRIIKYIKLSSFYAGVRKFSRMKFLHKIILLTWIRKKVRIFGNSKVILILGTWLECTIQIYFEM